MHTTKYMLIPTAFAAMSLGCEVAPVGVADSGVTPHESSLLEDQTPEEALGLEIALTLAVEQGELAEIERLLSEGADPDGLLGTKARRYRRAVDGLDVVRELHVIPTPLLACLRSMPELPEDHPSVVHRTEITKMLLDAGADPNLQAREWFGNFPLVFAVQARNHEVVSLLLDAGADPNMSEVGFDQFDPSTGPATALDAAVENADLHAVRLLLDADADPVTGGFVYVPLHRAGFVHDPKILQALLNHTQERYGDIDAEDLQKTVATLLDSWRNIYPLRHDIERLEQYRQCFRVLLDYDATADVRDEDVFYSVTEIEDQDLQSWYLSQISSQQSDGPIAFYWLDLLIEQEDIDGIREALDSGLDVNAVGEAGRVPLHHAVCTENTELVRLLIERGASPKAEDDYGSTPIDLASAEEVQQLLEEATRR